MSSQAEQKPKESKVSDRSEAIIVDETKVNGKTVNEPQTQTQTQQVPQPQPQPQPKSQSQPFHYTFCYSSSSIEKDGKRETQEKFEMRNPDMEITAEKRPGQDLYDVRLEKKTGDKPEIYSQQLPSNQVRDHIDQCMRDTNRRLDESMRLEYRPEPTKPAIQGSEPSHRPTGQQATNNQEPQRSVGLFERPFDRSQGLFDRPSERSLGLFDRPFERAFGLFERPFEENLSRRSDIFGDPFRMYDSFDHDFRIMEDEFRSMRDSMFRSFRNFGRKWY
jgi:hypothetical protein